MADEQPVLALIDGFNQIDLEAVLATLTPDAVYHNIPMDPVQGTQAIRAVLEGFTGAASEIQWDLLSIASADGKVLTERVDKFKIGGGWIELPVMGVFEVTDGKISAWRDYFDLAQFQTQMAALSSSE